MGSRSQALLQALKDRVFGRIDVVTNFTTRASNRRFVTPSSDRFPAVGAEANLFIGLAVEHPAPNHNFASNGPNQVGWPTLGISKGLTGLPSLAPPEGFAARYVLQPGVRENPAEVCKGVKATWQ